MGQLSLSVPSLIYLFVVLAQPLLLNFSCRGYSALKLLIALHTLECISLKKYFSQFFEFSNMQNSTASKTTSRRSALIPHRLSQQSSLLSPQSKIRSPRRHTVLGQSLSFARAKNKRTTGALARTCVPIFSSPRRCSIQHREKQSPGLCIRIPAHHHQLRAGSRKSRNESIAHQDSSRPTGKSESREGSNRRDYIHF